MAVRHDLGVGIWRGDTYTQLFQFKDDNAPLNITGHSLVFTLKLNPLAPDEEAELSYEATIPAGQTMGEEGKHVVTFQRSETSELKIGTYYYQLKLILPNTPEDVETTYLYGRIRVEDS